MGTLSCPQGTLNFRLMRLLLRRRSRERCLAEGKDCFIAFRLEVTRSFTDFDGKFLVAKYLLKKCKINMLTQNRVALTMPNGNKNMYKRL